MLAAQWAHYKQEEFAELDGELQSRIVAAHRCKMHADAVVAHEQVKESQRAAKRSQARAKR